MVQLYFARVINKLLLLKKRNLIFFLLCILQHSVFSQSPSTVGKIFDFSPGDEFHKHGIIPSTEPNANRIKIMDKFYSKSEDSIFYIVSYSNYHSTWVETPQPHLEYSFENFVDTLFYTHLDSSILSYLIMDQKIDTTDTLINFTYSFETCNNPCEFDIDKISVFKGFDGFGDTYTYFFSKGLGLTKTDFWYEGFGNYIYALFYLKKDEYSCGTPDLTSIGRYHGFYNNNSLDLYPNPAKDCLQIKGITIMEEDNIRICSSSGKLMRTVHYSNSGIDISGLESGVYFLLLEKGDGLYRSRFVVL